MAGAIRAVLIGCGGRAQGAHVPVVTRLDDVDLAAICDIDEQNLNTLGDQFGTGKRYNDYRRMVDEVAPDVVYAIGPPQYMYDIWVWCLKQGLHLFTEKPPGLTAHQVRILAALAEEKGLTTQVCLQRKFQPMMRRLRDECLAHGPIVHSVCTFYKRVLAPRTAASNHMYEDGIHALDTIRWMCGGEVVSVASRVDRVGVPDQNLHLAVIGFDNGSSGVLLTSFCTGRRVFRFEMHAPGISAEADEDGPYMVYDDGSVEGRSLDLVETAGTDDWLVTSGTVGIHRDFIDHVRAGTDASSSFQEAVKTVELCDRVLHSGI